MNPITTLSSSPLSAADSNLAVKRSVLYLAYFFPPRGGAAVQRSLKFARYLPQFGWRATVVASRDGVADNVTKVQDASLLAELPEGTSVHYTTLTTAEQIHHDRLQSRWRQRFTITDMMGWWVRPAVRMGMELIEKDRPDAILVTMSPFTAAQAGIELKRRTGLPLVFDLRDPWALDETRIYPTCWHGWRDRAAMARALAAADLVIMNTPQSALAVEREFPAQVKRRNSAGPGKVIAITNGYDASDFEIAPQPASASDVLRIVHTGMFHSEWATIWDNVCANRGLINTIKYHRRRINLWTRTPRFLLEAMHRAIRLGQIPDGKLELVLVGELSPDDRAMIERSPVASMVKMLGYRKHAESVSWLKSADVLFLPNHTPRDAGATLVVPGKTYEYLGSGRPILTMCGPGDMRDFVQSSNSGVMVEGDNVQGATDALVAFYSAKQSGKTIARQDRAVVETFERRNLTRRLAHALDELVEARHPTGRALK